MPSGRTHDRITLWSLPLIAGAVGLLTFDVLKMLLVAVGYLLGGLWLSPDLDIHSRPYLRWGPLRWLWLPYRRVMSHRSMLSHGPIVGTVLRLLYLGTWVGALAVVLVVCWAQYAAPERWPQETVVQLNRGLAIASAWLGRYPAEGLVLFLGLELGAMSHSLSDWSGSAWKRWRRWGFRAKRRRKR